MIDDYPAPNTRPHLSKWLLIATDLAMLLLANRLGFWLAERVRIWRDLPAFVASADSGLRLTVWLMLVLAAISWFWLVRGHYTQRRPFWDETRDVVIAMLVLAVVDAALMFMLKSPFSRLWWVATWAVSLFGVVLGRGDGAYPMLALSAKLGLGAVLGSGRQAAPWIHLDDALGMVRFALANDSLQGPVNAVAPDTQPQAAFVQALAASFGRTVWMRVPDAPMRWALGEMATLLLDGQNARPRAAVGAGYRFAYPKLQTALQSMADPARATPAAPVVAADLR